jgi:GR25 family glycosyltransferase involved in LPS biosynthesis
MIKHCYYINLEKRTDRKVFIEEQLNKSKYLKNIYKRFEAIDGYTIHPRDVEPGLLSNNAIEDVLMGTTTAWGLSLTQGGLGLLLSYVELFKQIENLDSPAITFEDDTTIDDDFDSNLEKVMNELPEDFDLCYLGYGDTPLQKELFSKNLSIPKGVVNCTPSLLISPKGAKKLLEVLKNVDNQIDTALYSRFKHLKVFVPNEKIVKIKNLLGTDIQGDNSCVKRYEKQNYIIATIAFGETANRNALKLAYDLNYFDQKLLIVTNNRNLFSKLSNVVIVDYPDKVFSYNDKIICFEEGFKTHDCVVYVDSDTRIFYKNYKNCYTSFFIKIKPGFHPGWDWGKLTRPESGFFNSTDISKRIKGYGELAHSISKSLGIPLDDAFHYQEGMLIISKDNGKEKMLLQTWKALSSVLDLYEIKNESKRIGVGEGNIVGLAVANSGIKVNTTEIQNYFGVNLKYNFYVGGQIKDHIKHSPDRKTVKIGDGTLIKTNSINVNFKDKNVDLSYDIYDINDNLMVLTFNWNTKSNVEVLDHEFKINDIIYHFNSEKKNELIFEKKQVIEIYHTYDWYGEKNFELIDKI